MPIPVDRAGNTTGIIGSPSPGMEEGRRHRRPTRDLRHHPGRVSAGWRRGLPHTARTTSPHTEPRPTRTARTVPASSPDSVAGARRSSGPRRTDNQPVRAARPTERNLHDSPIGGWGRSVLDSRRPKTTAGVPEPTGQHPARGHRSGRENRPRAARPGPPQPAGPGGRRGAGRPTPVIHPGFPQTPVDLAGFPRINGWH